MNGTIAWADRLQRRHRVLDHILLGAVQLLAAAGVLARQRLTFVP